MKSRCSAFFLVLVPILICAGPSTADNGRSQKIVEKKLPILGEHLFSPSIFVAQPFVTTYVQSILGFGAAVDYMIPLYDTDGSFIRDVSGDIAFLTIQFEYQQAVNSWLAFNANVNTYARVGINEESVLSQGISGIGGFGLGTVAQIWRGDKAILSGSLDMTSSQIITVDLLSYATTVIDSGGITDDNQLLTDASTTNVFGGLRFAYALNKWVGFLVNGFVGRAESVVGEGTRWEGAGELGVSVDVGAGTSVPIAISGALTYASYSENGDDVIDKSNGGMLRVGYNGRDDFSVALETTFRRATTNSSEDSLKVIGAVLTMLYFF